eukprot:366228-Chlamydomonas_euryale.AAC.15
MRTSLARTGLENKPALLTMVRVCAELSGITFIHYWRTGSHRFDAVLIFSKMMNALEVFKIHQQRKQSWLYVAICGK